MSDLAIRRAAELAQARQRGDGLGGVAFFVRLRGLAGDRLAFSCPEGYFWADCGESVRACVWCRLYTCGHDEAENEAHESCREEMAREVGDVPPTATAAPPDNVVRDWQFTDWATLGGKLGAQRGESRRRKGGKKL